MLAYMDHAAGGPLDPSAAAAMLPWIAGRYGNPSGGHRVARAARAALDDARDAVAEFVGVEPGGIVFTSGGTESDNLAVLGTLAARPGAVVVSAVEHPAVMAAALASGNEVRVAGVGPDGIVDSDSLARLLDGGVSLVSIQLANHETGVVQPLEELFEKARRLAPRAVLHTDAVQAAPWLDLRREAACADLISLSGHKLGGPQGSGVLANRGRFALRPVVHGGGQERELRSGTQNVAGCVGLAAAAGTASARRTERTAAARALRDDLERRVLAGVTGCVRTAPESPRLPGHLHLRFEGVESEALVLLLDTAGLCASAGAACSSGAVEPSPVLLAMGISKEAALSALRLSLGPRNTEAEVVAAAGAVVCAVERLRSH